MKYQKRKEFIERIEDLDELDDVTVEKIKVITNSTTRYSRNEFFKGIVELVDDIINDCFEDIEKLFMPYIKQHKKVHNLINKSLISLQEKNLKQVTTKEDILVAKEIYLDSINYLKNILPENLKELSNIKHIYSIKRINDTINISSASRPTKIKILGLNNKLYKSIMEIYFILEEELNSIFIEELNDFFMLEIELAERLQNNEVDKAMNIENVYECIIFEKYPQIDMAYKTPKTYTQLIKLAEKQGFNFCRQCKTSHAIYKNKNNKIIVIPNKGNVVAPIGTQFKILKRIFY